MQAAGVGVTGINKMCIWEGCGVVVGREGKLLHGPVVEGPLKWMNSTPGCVCFLAAHRIGRDHLDRRDTPWPVSPEMDGPLPLGMCVLPGRTGIESGGTPSAAGALPRLQRPTLNGREKWKKTQD